MAAKDIKTDSPDESTAQDSHAMGLHTVAVYEAAKGALVLAAGLGLLTFVHYDIQRFGESIVHHLNMDPAKRYPQIFLQALGKVTDKNIYWLAGGAALYSTVRFVEAYGLWRDRVWAEWLAIISGGIYMPIEFYELYKHVTKTKLFLTGFNALLVAYLLYVRFSKLNSAELEADGEPGAVADPELGSELEPASGATSETGKDGSTQ